MELILCMNISITTNRIGECLLAATMFCVIVILAIWSLTRSFDLYMVRQQPLNVCMGGVAVTLNTRYERLCVEHLMSLAHFPRTGVFIEYD